ncbi:MAG: 50S ribosomal protein L24 [Clostridia bacterium]|nr:50S ribosomal protein L24 [Clostridia bacterium]MBT7122380.1 50S ribosomal protein L24 [Clostridia bacterium]
MANLHIKRDDKVVVISGKDKGKTGKVLLVEPKSGKLIVEKLNMVTKHEKPKGQGKPGGIIHSEAPMYASKVMLVCAKCGKATRLGFKVLEDGGKVRVCKKCGETFDK